MNGWRETNLGDWSATSWRPRPPLSETIEEVWSVRGRQATAPIQVPPFPGVQLLFNLGDAYVVDGVPRREAWIEGIGEGPLTTAAAGATHLVGVRFRPWGAARLLGPATGECAGRVVEAELVLGPAVRTIRQRLLEPATEAARCRVVGEFVAARLTTQRSDVEMAVRQLVGSAGGSVEAAARWAGVGNRTFRRECVRLVGIPPKRLARLLRFDRTIGALAGQPVVDWSDFAAAHGYYDQSHLIREWRAFFDMSPVEFMQRRAAFGQYVAMAPGSKAGASR